MQCWERQLGVCGPNQGGRPALHNQGVFLRSTPLANLVG
jgi:hypothetical protein